MIVGCGIDIEAISRFEKYLNDWEKHQSFFFMVYGADEIVRCRSFRPEISFPLSFCCKEAVFKALGQTPFTSNVDWREVELLFDAESGLDNCQVLLSGCSQQIAKQLGVVQVYPKFEITDGHIIFTILLAT